eukprot:XP_025014800.1 cytochrome P450 76A1 isoform X2 [Ricinus communis]
MIVSHLGIPMDWRSYSNLLAWLSLAFSASALLLLLKCRQSRHHHNHSPPGPPAWPIFGNIFDLGTIPHRNLYKFRKVPDCCTAHNYDQGAVSLGRYGSIWRFHRRLITLDLMTNKRIKESAFLRIKCINSMIQYIEEDTAAARARGELGEVVIAHYLFVMTFNLIGNLVLSQDLANSQSNEGLEFSHAMDKITVLSGKPNATDLWPFLKMFDPQRIKRDMEREMGKALRVVEGFVRERIEERKLEKERSKKDFLDALLEFESDEEAGPDKISIQTMFIIILEIFFAGTETTSSTMEWAMTELLRCPESIKRVKEELKRVVGQKRKVEESDIDQLPYLQAVLKETMRLHPTLPLLIPRNSLEDTNFMGYLIPKDTQVFVNVWAIGRDPESWQDPNSFKPERFLESDIDYRGKNFEYLPFGSGRRICAGILLAQRVLHLGLASLLHCFDWELSSNYTPDSIDMKEKMGMAVRKLVPLKAIPKKRMRE